MLTVPLLGLMNECLNNIFTAGSTRLVTDRWNFFAEGDGGRSKPLWSTVERLPLASCGGRGQECARDLFIKWHTISEGPARVSYFILRTHDANKSKLRDLAE